MAERVTPELVAELRSLLAKATPGEWRRQVAACDHVDQEEHTAIKGDCRLVTACVEEDADAELIASLRNHAPALLDALDEARASLSVERETLRLIDAALEHYGATGDRGFYGVRGLSQMHQTACRERDEARAEAQALVEEVAKLRAAARDAFWFLTGTWDGKRMQSQSDVTGALAQALASREGPKGGAT